MIKGVTHAHLIRVHSDIPYSSNQFLDRDFFNHLLQKSGSSYVRDYIIKAVSK